MNHPGAVAFPIENRSVTKGAGPVTKHFQKGIARGHANPDHNVKLRGIGTRIDKLKP